MHYFLFEDFEDLVPFHLAIREKSLLSEPLTLTNLSFKNLSQKNLAKLSHDSLACRALLSELLVKLTIDMATLDDSNFPYQLVARHGAQISKYAVSFSHSRERLAVLLVKLDEHSSLTLGVDIEDKTIRKAVAERFFHPAEVAWLQGLEIIQQPLARKLLWTLKESFIKAQADKNSQLIQGLQCNMLAYISPLGLANLLTVNPINLVKSSKKVGHIFGFIPTLQCGFVLIKKRD